MTRPKTISKSNYFKYLIPEVLYTSNIPQLITSKYKNDQVMEFLWIGSVLQRTEVLSNYGIGTSQRLGRIIEKLDNKKLERLLEEDKEKSVPTNYYSLLELIAHLTLKYVPDVEAIVEMYNLEGESSDTELDDIRFVLGYAYENVLPAIEKKYSKGYKVREFSINKNFKDEVPSLIKGYKQYLKLLNTKKLPKREACRQVEKATGMVNIRGEFHKYDRYFDEMSTIAAKILSNEFPDGFHIEDDIRVKLLSTAYDLALSL